MSNIELKGLLQQKSREFGVEGSGLDRFESDMLNAVNRSINRINLGADLETRITRVTNLESQVALDDAYEHVLSDAVTVELINSGQRPAKGEEVSMGILVNRVKSGIDSIRSDLLNQSQANVTDSTDGTVGWCG